MNRPLPHLFGQVHIPQAIHDEIHYHPEAIGAVELQNASWLVTHTISNTIAATLLLDQLDKGETEAIMPDANVFCGMARLNH